MIVKHEMYGETYQLSLQFAKYANGQTAIKLWDMTDGFPFATATIAVDDQLLEDEVAIKNYSENEGILFSLIEAGVVDYPHEFIQSGHVNVPVCKLKIKINE